MKCRSLLWIAAAVASVGAAVWSPPAARAEPGPAWGVTIDDPAAGTIVESKHLTIAGTVTSDAGIDEVTVAVTPQRLPEWCGSRSGPATVLDGGGYVAELDVECNGPHRIEVHATGPSGSSNATPVIVKVAEPPPTPAVPWTTVTAEGGLRATWDPGDDPDSEGSILVVNYRHDRFAPGIGEATLPPSDRRAAVSVRTLRWGADGPGTTISSPESGGRAIGEVTPTTPTGPADPPPPPADPDGTPTPPPDTPSSQPLPSPNDVAEPATPSATSAPVAAAPVGSIVSRGRPATTTDRAEPGERRPPRQEDRAAVATAAAGRSLVRTGEERPSTRWAVIALVVLLIAVVCVAVTRGRSPRPLGAGRGFGRREDPTRGEGGTT